MQTLFQAYFIIGKYEWKKKTKIILKKQTINAQITKHHA